MKGKHVYVFKGQNAHSPEEPLFAFLAINKYVIEYGQKPFREVRRGEPNSILLRLDPNTLHGRINRINLSMTEHEFAGVQHYTQEAQGATITGFPSVTVRACGARRDGHTAFVMPPPDHRERRRQEDR
jgi:hypothetical protein